MTEIFGIPMQALLGQLLIGLINGAFYAMLSLGLAVIFGLLNIINFTHGAQYMLGAFCAWLLLEHLGIGYWWALLIAPLVVGAFGWLIERTMLSRLYKLDHLYGLLLTFGLALVLQGLFTNYFGSSGQPYRLPDSFTGGYNLGFMFLPSTARGSSWPRASCASGPGTSSSAPSSGATCAPRRRIRRWCRRSASTCRAWCRSRTPSARRSRRWPA
jgi:ABC-type branched-subunit amino acid transport system permease subunit